MSAKQVKYVAFLRGINVGGHHKVPMADLRQEMQRMGCENVVTILNTGNIIFDHSNENVEHLEKSIAGHLESTFGFPIPTIIRQTHSIQELYQEAPFQDVEVTKDIRLYISLLREEVESPLEIPWTSPDGSYKILMKKDKAILSVLDLSVSKTTKAMEILEKTFGKGITTRNWKTIERVIKKLD